MNAPSQDIKDILIESPSVTELEFKVNLFCFKQPDTPDLCLTLYDTGGYAPQANYKYDRPTIQMRVRGNQNGYREAYSLIENAKEYLRGIHNKTINGARYIGIWLMSDIFFAGYDKKDRPEFTVNVRIHRTQ